MTDFIKEDLVNKQELAAVKDELLDKLANKEEVKAEFKQVREELEAGLKKGREELEAGLKKGREELKQETSKLSTKESLDIVAGKVVRLSVDLSEFKGEMNDRLGSLENKFDKMMTAIDHIAGELTDTRTEKVAVDYSLIHLEKKVDDHDVRIKRLEQQSA